ncbi:uncharacterized protein LOC112988655 [Dromaius novaehollandiae]|uniref:uncharacterized protein LOC112988655 n=1 Tax=Dromaius novaehollandiae TaxID=8790 RepID=UPI00311F3601
MASLACTAASAGLPLAGLLGEASTHPGSELGMLPEPGTLLPHHPSAPVAGGERRDAGPAPPAPGPTLAMVAMGAILATVGMLGCYCSVRRHRHQVLQVFTGLVLLGLGSTLFFASSDYKLCIAYWYLLWGAVLYGVAGYYISSTAINPSRPLGFLWLMMIFTVFEMVISSITFSYSLLSLHKDRSLDHQLVEQVSPLPEPQLPQAVARTSPSQLPSGLLPPYAEGNFPLEPQGV